MAEYTKIPVTNESCRMDDKKQEFAGMMQDNQNGITISKQEGNKFQQYLCTIIVSVGALIIGSVLAWTSPTLKLLTDLNSTAPLHVTEEEFNFIAAVTPIGAIFGALPAGFFADLLGRKNAFMIFTIPWIGCWILTTFAQNAMMLYIARFISGALVGLFCTILPMYVNEIAEDSIRGLLGTLFQLFITIGILMDFILGIFESYYILCNTITAVSILFLILLIYVPETPFYLMKTNRRADAEKSLKRLRGPYYDLHTELNELRKTLEDSSQQAFQISSIFTAVNIKALYISLGLMIFQQMAGINAVIFFAQDIFIKAGASNPAICTIIVGIVQTIATVISSILVDRAGRKILLLISSIGMGISLAALGYYFYLSNQGTDTSKLTWLPLVSLVLFIIVFSLGFGPLPWMMASEVLATEIKSFGTGIAVATNWICVAIVTFYFQLLIKLISAAYTFWLFTIVCSIATLFVFLVVPETKGKSLQQIQNELAGRNN